MQANLKPVLLPVLGDTLPCINHPDLLLLHMDELLRYGFSIGSETMMLVTDNGRLTLSRVEDVIAAHAELNGRTVTLIYHTAPQGGVTQWLRRRFTSSRASSASEFLIFAYTAEAVAGFAQLDKHWGFELTWCHVLHKIAPSQAFYEKSLPIFNLYPHLATVKADAYSAIHLVDTIDPEGEQVRYSTIVLRP